MENAAAGVTIESPGRFWRGSTGRWAGEQLLRAARAGQPLSPQILRTLDTLTHDEWIDFDREVVSEAVIQLVGVADLISMGLTTPIKNAMGKTIHEYEKMTDMDPATVSLDGIVRTDNDVQEFLAAGVPLPITHKDFFIPLRKLIASRTTGEGLDTIQARTAGRVVSEMQEQMLFLGGKTFGTLPIYGYTTFPDRITLSFGSGGNWGLTTKLGSEYLADTQSIVRAANAKRMYGPFMVYIPRDANVNLGSDFKANGDKLPSGTVVAVQMTKDTVELLQGEPLQSIQWDIEGGFQINFKAFMIQIALMRSTAAGRCGIVHMS